MSQSSPAQNQQSAENAAPPRKCKTTPLSMQQLVPMTFVLLNESLCAAVLQPFGAALVAFLQNRPREEAGYAAGILVGMFMLGQVASAHTWGWLSDQYGRRFPLISGLFTSGVMVLLFGLSGRVWQCALFRFMQGLFNGNVLVAKTMMADITDKTNQAMGFAFVSLCFGFGTLIGPGVGGILYDPTRSGKMSWLGLDPNGIFASRPALLPCLVIFVYSIVGMAICTFFVQETNPKAKPLPPLLKTLYPCLWRPAKQFVLPPIQYEDENDTKKEELGEEAACSTGGGQSASPVAPEDTRRCDDLVEELAEVGTTRPSRTSSDRYSGREQSTLSGEAESAVVAVQETSEPRIASRGSASAPADASKVTAVEVEAAAPAPAPAEEFGYKQAFARPVTRYMLVNYMVISAADYASAEAFALFAIASTTAGCLGFTVAQLSYVLLTNSVPVVAANLVFQKVCSLYNDKIGLFRIGASLAGLAVFVLSLTSYIGVRFPQVVVMLLCTSSKQFFVSWCYSLITMLTARAAPDGHVGAIMGINQSCGALMRGITPFIADPLFAWSVSGHHVPPFNHMLVFTISAILFWLCWGRSYSVGTGPDGKVHTAKDLGEPGFLGHVKMWFMGKKRSHADEEPVIESDSK